MNATYELQSPEGVTELLDQIRSSFSGKLRVTVTSLASGDESQPEDDEDYIDHLMRNPVTAFTPLTREEANDRYL